LKCIIPIFLLCTHLSFAQGAWVQKNNLLGISRYNPVGFNANGKGYIGLGKGNSNAELFKDFWEYNPVTDTWTQKADFPGGKRVGALGISINDKGYVGTGSNPDQNLQNDWWEYNAQFNFWLQKADFPGGGRDGMTGFSLEGAAYLGTGLTSSFVPCQDWWRYDPNTDSWLQRANLPGPSRAYAAGFVIDSKVFIGTGFGFQSGSFNYLNDFWEYDIATDNWVQKNNFPGGKRGEAHGFSLGSTGYLGLGTKLIGSGTVDDFWRYFPNSDNWQQISDFGGGLREMTSGFTIECKHYICAGFINDQDQKNDLWEFSLDTCYTAPPEPPVVETEGYFIPNVFSPNGDNSNDFWTTNFIDKSEYLMILNRWGQVITEINMDQPKWDGSSNGEPSTDGVYFYRGMMRGENKSGYFHLVR
jgi:gliding motility-associated-like protein